MRISKATESTYAGGTTAPATESASGRIDTSASAEASKDDGATKKVKGTYAYRSSISSEDRRAVFYYSDEYFSGSAMRYDEHLATMSLCAAMAAMNSHDGGTKDYKNKSVNIRELLDKLGFSDIAVDEDFTEKPSENSIGAATANKKLDIDGTEYTLIPVAIRGAGYEKEWIGNLDIGSEGDAQGFSVAADRAESFVEEYIEKYGIDTAHIKFWITGFSRAAAVADILTARFTEKYDPAGTNVFGYSFATPRAAYNPTKTYQNSHCIINPSDIVPYLAPNYLGFTHYGVEHYVPEADSGTIYESGRLAFRTQLSALDAESLYDDSFKTMLMKATYAFSFAGIDLPDGYEIEPSQMVALTQSEFADRLMYALAGGVAYDRKALTEDKLYDDITIEDVLSKLIRYGMTSSEEHKEKLMREISELKKDKDLLELAGMSLGIDDVIDAIHDGYADLSDEKQQGMCVFLWTWLEPHFKAALTNSEYKELKKIWKSFVYVFMGIAHYDYTHSEEKGLLLIGTLMENGSAISGAHSPELYLAWLRSQDTYYSADTAVASQEKEKNAFKIGDAEHVNAAVKVVGVDDMQTETARIVGGIVTESEDEGVTTRALGDSEEKLRQGESVSFYTVESDATERAVELSKSRTYSVELKAAEPDEGMQFSAWVDENDEEISSEETYTIAVEKGAAEISYARPVYETVPEETPAPTATPAPEEPEEEESEESSALPWVLGGVGVLVLGGGAAFIVRRKKTLH